MIDAIDITTGQRKTILEMLESHLPGTVVWAYGSRVKWASRPASDLDLVVFASPDQKRQVSDLKEALEESDVPFRVDIFEWDEVPEGFRKNIEAEHVVLQSELSPIGPLPKSWTIAPLSEVTIKIGSGATPRGGSKVYLPKRETYAIVRSQNVFDRLFCEEGLSFISNANANELKNVALEEDDVLLNITGDGITFGRSCLAPRKILPAVVNQHVVRIRCDLTRCHPGYLVSYLTHPAIKQYIESFNAGGSRRAITKGHIESFEMPLPPIPEQRAIAHILGSLDDKIELNRQMNRTLEKMAQAIFKSWFIDFDPVRAKAEGRNPGLPKDIANLFPDSFEGSDLGKIPKGWEVKPLSSIITLIGGGTPKTSVPDYWEGDIPWFSVVDAPSEHDIWVIDTEKHVTQMGIDNSSTKILPIKTTIISARGTVGKCALVGSPMAINQSCYGIRPVGSYGEICTNFTVRNQIVTLQRSGHGSVFNTITRATFDSIRIADSGCAISLAFDKIVDSYLTRIIENLRETSVLSRTRDTLLPKLISGEVRIPDAEKFIAGAGV